MNNFYRVSFCGNVYGIALSGNRIGVCKNAHGRIKYMPVVFSWKSNAYYLPKLYKTRLSVIGSAINVLDTLVVCDLLQTNPAECMRVCEHILKHGRNAR